ncbi:hypothetical protein DL771_009406 [Monosporascus sp. 5C6A]|nr:hypothetical protein DL771_009406 [Monosporascus sp. 5C6A]
MNTETQSAKDQSPPSRTTDYKDAYETTLKIGVPAFTAITSMQMTGGGSPGIMALAGASGAAAGYAATRWALGKEEKK